MAPPDALEQLREMRRKAHLAYYKGPTPASTYEDGLRWGILATLDTVLDLLTDDDPPHDDSDRLDRRHRNRRTGSPTR